MSVSFCAVVGCPNQFAKTSASVLFHRFPVDELFRKKWLVSCGRKIDSDASELSVCSEHFTDDDYVSFAAAGPGPSSCRKLSTLKRGATPHLNLFQIKQERLDANDVEYIGHIEYRTQNSTSCPNMPRSQSISGCSTLESADFENGATCESTSCNLGMAPMNNIESSSTTTMTNLKEEPTPSTSCNYIPSSLPACQNWPGAHDFAVSFRPQEKTTKGVSWTYSKQKDKLYVGKDVPCPINFSCNGVMPDNVTIRAMALYSSPEHTSEIVHRCVNHSMEELQTGLFEAEHLVRCESSMATYDVDKNTRRHSVWVPFENPQAGQQFSTYIFKFACFGSCAGGPNRRPLMLVFTLEKGSEVIGRRKIDVKICACPGRDRRTEEKDLGEEKEKTSTSSKRKESEMINLSTTLEFTRSVEFPAPKKTKTSRNEEGYYIIKTRDKETYDYLKQMKKLREICHAMENLSPEVKKYLINLSRKKNNDQDD